MRKQVKSILDRAGILDFVEPFYFNLRSASPSAIWSEFRPGGKLADDGYPFPPSKLIYDVIACRWRQVYYDSGEAIIDDMEQILASNGRPLSDFDSILDFGCGSGRLLRHVRQRTDAELSGSDYNPEMIAWCDSNLPFGTFESNPAEPPLAFDNEAFDFAYARSVFTHIPPDAGKRWMKELARVLRPGGRLYFTMHGRAQSAGLTEPERREFESGRMVVTFATVAGQNLCSTFADRDFVEREFLDGFELVAFVPGRDLPHLRQDVYLVEKQ
jgi:SAM-dependent methyltransferase